MKATLADALNRHSGWNLVGYTLCLFIVTACAASRSQQDPVLDFRQRLRSIDCEDGGQFVDVIQSLGPIGHTSCGGEATPISNFTYVSFKFQSGDVLTLYTKPMRWRLCGSIELGNLKMLDSVVVTRVVFGRTHEERRYRVDTIVERRAGR